MTIGSPVLDTGSPVYRLIFPPPASSVKGMYVWDKDGAKIITIIGPSHLSEGGMKVSVVSYF